MLSIAMIYLSYFVEFGSLHYTRKRGIIAFLFIKSGVYLENIRF